MSKIRQEINLLDTVATATLSTPTNVGGYALVDPTQYSGTVTYYTEIVAKSSSPGSIFSVDAGAVITDSDFSLTTSYARYRKQWTSAPSSSYPVTPSISSDDSSTISIKAIRVLVFQDTGSSALTSTETQIEIGNQETGKTNTSSAALTNPKYWNYDSSKWDGTTTFYAEVTLAGSSASHTKTVKLQEDDGAFGSWADKVTIVNAASTTTTTRTRSASFTPTTGRNYRIVSQISSNMSNYSIYNAKIIVQQVGPVLKDSIAASTNTSKPIRGGTAGSGETNQAGGMSFTTTSAYDMKYIELYMSKVNSPSDNVYLELLSGSITGTVLGTSENVAASTVSSSSSFIRFTFATPISLANATKYYIRAFRTGSFSAGTYTQLVSDAIGYAGGGAYNRDNTVWSAEHGTDDVPFRIYDGTAITKLEPQYLLANTAVGAGTGLQDFDTYWDPAEWSGVTNTYYHEGQNVASGTSDIKLQQDPNGSPSDVTSSTVTDVVERERSSAMTMPASAQTIDVNQTGT